jgi:hypothetical protein
MAKQENMNQGINEEISKFKKTKEELHLLRNVSKDLRNYMKMIKLKKYD